MIFLKQVCTQKNVSVACNDNLVIDNIHFQNRERKLLFAGDQKGKLFTQIACPHCPHKHAAGHEMENDTTAN